MAYATQAELVASIGEDQLRTIGDYDLDGTAESPAIVAALAEASGLADTYLQAYLPISPTPEVLRRAIISIACQHLMLARNNGTDYSKLAYENAIAWLKDIAKGLATLPLPVDAGPNASTAVSPVVTAESRHFTRTTIGLLF